MTGRLLSAAVLALLVTIVACGGGDDDGTEYTAEEIVANVQAAVIQPGMIVHAVGDDGSEVWLDPENELFRRQESPNRGGLTSVGDGWIRYGYDPFNNVVTTEDLSPGGGTPRINTPMAPWWEPLTALAYGVELTVIGATTADGQEVIAVEARSPVLDGDGQFSGNFLEGRAEFDPETFLPTAFEQREIVAEGQSATQPTPAQRRIKYTAELLPTADVPEGFFSQDVVKNAVLTVEENLQKVRDLSLTPYWLGEEFIGEGGILRLPDNDNFFVDEGTQTAEIHYGYFAPISEQTGETLPDSVLVRLATDTSVFVPPEVPSFGGDIPEQRQEVTVRGGTGVVLGSLLTPSDLPCDSGSCPATRAPLYYRIVLQIGDTAVQIEAMARVDSTGADRNHYNSVQGVIALAEALTEAISATPTTAP